MHISKKQHALRDEVESVVREGNICESGTVRLIIVMAAELYKHKANPSSQQINKATETLVRKHPCLKQNGSKTGYEGGKNSLNSLKIGNYRTKLSTAGIKGQPRVCSIHGQH